MRVNRPACWSTKKQQLALLLFFSGFVFSLTGEELILPDIIYTRLTRPVITQPEGYPDVAETWKPSLPVYRRMYPVLQPLTFTVGMKIPMNFPAQDSSRLVVAPLALSINYNDVPKHFDRIRAGTTINIREGWDTTLDIAIPGGGMLGGVFFLPFPDTSPRPLSGGMNWSRIGRLSADVSLGVKNDGGVMPFFSGHISWNGEVVTPDLYFLDLFAYGLDDPGISIKAGMKIDTYIKDSEWFIHGELASGGWFSPHNGSGLIRTILAAGYGWSSIRMIVSAGVDLAYSWTAGFKGTPYVSVQWSPDQHFSLYAKSRLNTAYPKSLDTVLRREQLKGFDPEIPLNGKVQLGMIMNSGKGISCTMDITYNYGFFSTAVNGYTRIVEDRRFSGNAELSGRMGNHGITVSGRWDISFDGYTYLWETQLEYAFYHFAVYVSAGTEDAIFARYFTGIRGEQPIMGAGVRWNVDKNWGIETYFYSEIPWNKPSLIFSLKWRK